MVRTEHDEEAGRALLLIIPQIFTWFYFGRVIALVTSHWREVLNYQAHSNHLSLPLGVQDSLLMMMIGVRPSNTKKLWTNS